MSDKLSAKDEATYNALSKLDGGAFDKAYARDMVRDHRTDIAEFQKEAQSGEDLYVKTFASNTVPTLQEHLKLAQQMMQSVSGRSRGTGSGSPQ